MKKTNKLPQKKVQTIGMYKVSTHRADDTSTSTDTTSSLSLSTTHLFNI